jgi:hypothetical protein
LDPRPLDEDPRSIEAALRWHLHGTILEENSKNRAQKRVHGLENQDVS